jgi:hypothetical protein
LLILQVPVIKVDFQTAIKLIVMPSSQL